MPRFDVITLFPDAVRPYLDASILGRAQGDKLIEIHVHNPRDWTTDAYHRVDEPPYGGGAGMVMQCAPLWQAWQALQPVRENARIILTSPLGRPLTAPLARDLSTASQVVIFCGHYEGMDARLLSLIPQLEPVSLGDVVLTGGELAAMAIVDSVTRFVPGALGKSESSEADSFEAGVLEHPHYTRPAQFEGHPVPEVVLPGHHEKIAQWRRAMALHTTRLLRPDLWTQLQPLSKADAKALALPLDDISLDYLALLNPHQT